MFRNSRPLVALIGLWLVWAAGCVEIVKGTVDLTQAEFHFRMENYEGAIPHLEAYVAENPGSTQFRNKLGFAYLKTGRLEQAAAQLEKVLEITPGDPHAVLYLGMAYVNLEEYGKAAEVWQGYRERSKPLVEAEIRRQVTLLLIVDSQRAARKALAAEAGLRAAVPGAGPDEHYRVQTGDTLSHIAVRSGVSVSELMRLNGLEDSRIQVGQRLRIGGGDASGIPPPASQAVSPDTVAVCYYRDLSVDRSLRAFQKALAAMVITDLSRVSSLRVVERLRLQALLEEMELGRTGIVDPATAPRVGRLLGAETLVVGSLSPGSILSATSLASSTSGEIKGSGTAGVSDKNFFELPKAIVRNVIEGLKISLSPAEEEAIGVPQTRVYEAFIHYGLALDALDEGKWQNAKDLFAKAIKWDPDFALARDAYEACPGPGAPSVSALRTMSGREISSAAQAAVEQALAEQAELAERMQGVPLHGGPSGGGPSGGGGGHCFAFDTRVLMADSTSRRIVDLRVGDRVRSLDLRTGETVSAEVAVVYAAEQDHYYLINGEIRVTDEHPFFLAGGGTERAADLQPGDRLLTQTGVRPVASIRRVARGQAVYNLRVQGPSNYFVSVFGEDYFLVHNK